MTQMASLLEVATGLLAYGLYFYILQSEREGGLGIYTRDKTTYAVQAFELNVQEAYVRGGERICRILR